ncbi:MAG: hypothetical protein GX612_05960 [Bacteroidales bacterium]|jgi:hypothetical protein|nr:hypothetical protein [Bacteroidales bacterium]
MDTTDSIVDIYEDFARKTKRKIYYAQTPYKGTIQYGMINLIKTLCIPNDSFANTFLLAYHNPYLVNGNELFFGVFFPLSFDTSIKIDIREKDILDKLNPFLKHKTAKSNVPYFDSMTVMTTNDTYSIERLINHKKMQRFILDALKITKALHVGLNTCYTDFAPAFTNKSHFGIYTTQQWLSEDSVMEALFSQAERIRDLFKQKELI